MEFLRQTTNKRQATNYKQACIGLFLFCKYHIVFAPKYRRKEFYGSKRLEIGKMIRELCKWKEVNLIEGEVCPDHVHILVENKPCAMGACSQSQACVRAMFAEGNTTKIIHIIFHGIFKR